MSPTLSAMFHFRDFLSISAETNESTILSANLGRLGEFIRDLRRIGLEIATSAIFKSHSTGASNGV